MVYVIGSVISTLILTHSGTLPGSSSGTVYIGNWNIGFGAVMVMFHSSVHEI